MTPDEVNRIIAGVLRRLGMPERKESRYFEEERYRSVGWLPSYVWQVEDRMWAIELTRGDRVPETTVKAMVELSRIDSAVQPAFFVPEGEKHEHLKSMCKECSICLIAKISDEYEILSFPIPGGPAVQGAIARIPEWVVERLSGLHKLDPDLRSAIGVFARRYRKLLDSGGANDENQATLLRNALSSLLRCNQDFAAQYTPLHILSLFEQSGSHHGARDHYFHTFNDFLLGCIVLDECYADFEKFRRMCFPRTSRWSIEYVWLLTVLFHDVGYTIQKLDETLEMILGVPSMGKERAIAERKEAWEAVYFRTSRAQLVSLYEHLIQKRIRSSWSADPFPLQDHALDRAFGRSFLEKGHGVASCMRMLVDFYNTVPSSAPRRQFLIQHVFLAGLSMPFHDWPVRECLRTEGIKKLWTSRFPFAGVLMFIDSIQEDRRGKIQTPDILTNIRISDHTVRAEMNLTLLSAEQLEGKKQEARDVADFLEQDLLKFEYPSELL